MTDGELPPYVAREADLSLDERLEIAFDADEADWRNRLIVVAGPPKSGKTRSMLNRLKASEWKGCPVIVLSLGARLRELANALDLFEDRSLRTSERVVIVS